MSSELKLDVVISLDPKEPESCSSNGKFILSESKNGLYKMINGIQKQGYRGLSDRQNLF